MSSDPAVVFRAFPAQERFAAALFSGRYRYLAYGGAIRGGKTFLVLALVFALARIFARSRWAVVRRDLPTLRRNTIPSLEKLRPAGFVEPLHQGTWSYHCRNGSEILLFPESIEKDPDLDRWKGLEVNGFVLEEANELAEKSWHKSIERAGTWIIPPAEHDPTPVQPPPLVLLTFNPAANWVKRVFYDPHQAGNLEPPFFFQPATIEDNPYVGAEFRESLKNLPSEQYNRFVLGQWEGLDEPDQLIKYEWVTNARTVTPIPGKQRLGVDVARFGDDKTVLCLMDGNRLVELVPHAGLSTDRTATIVAARIVELSIDADAVQVDGVGLGAGVVDNLHRDGFGVIDVIAGAKAIERDLGPGEQDDSVFEFYDLRSQMWWTVREMLRKGELALPEIPRELAEDLTAPRYEIRTDRKLKVESKDEIKKRIGRSTDYGDAFILAVVDANAVEPLIA